MRSTRILRVKLRSGLFDASPADGRRIPAPEVMASPAVRELAREAVRKSLVLLKNDNGALPLKRGRMLVVGKGADSLPMQTGGWSLTWQGDNTKTSDYPNADTLLSAMRKSLGVGNVDYSPDGAGVDVSRYSGIVVVAAEKPYAETAGDIVFPASLRHSSRYPEDLAALDRVSGKGVPVVTLSCSRAGRCPPTT